MARQKESFRRLRHRRQRARRGWCDADADDISNWLFCVMPEMLDALKNRAHGYPPRLCEDDENQSHEHYMQKWREIISEISAHMRAARNNELLEETKTQHKDKALMMLSEWIYDLWD